jgi:uncharacterized protein
MISTSKRLFIAIVLFAVACGSAVHASTPQPPDTPRDYVVDLAGIMSGDRQHQLNALLKELEQKTAAQVLVLTIQSLDNQSIEEFALATKEKWRLGQKGKDNGLLIVVALKDRKYRIEVGYGLESVLPDSLVGSIGREYFVPYFRKGDYSTGIYAGTVAVVRTIAAHEGVQIMNGSERPTPGNAYSRKPISAFNMIVLAIFGVVVLILFITNPRQCLLMLFAFSMGGGGRGGWSGGDGGFGGGGSFGGGGGGSGGGGGASGGW